LLYTFFAGGFCCFYLLTGAWEKFDDSVETKKVNYPWGVGDYIPNGTLIFDLLSDNPYFQTGFNRLSISQVIYDEEKNTIELNLFFRDEDIGNLKLHYVSDSSFLFEDFMPVSY